MRVRFASSDLERLYDDASYVSPRFARDVVRAYRKKVGFLVAAETEQDLRNYRALRLEKLRGHRAGQHSVRLNDQWRLILRMEGDDQGRVIVVIEIVDYH